MPSSVLNTAALEAPNVNPPDQDLHLLVSSPASVCSIGVGPVAPPSPAAFAVMLVRDRVAGGCLSWSCDDVLLPICAVRPSSAMNEPSVSELLPLPWNLIDEIRLLSERERAFRDSGHSLTLR